MRFNKFFIFTVILISSVTAFSQRPAPNGMRWFQRFDSDKNGTIEAEEYRAATDEFFKDLDGNKDGIIDAAERPKNPRPQREGNDKDRPNQFPPPMNGRPPRPENEMPRPPFFVMESIKRQGNIDRAEYDRRTNEQFSLMDEDKNGTVSLDEAEKRFEEVRNNHQNQPPPIEGRPPLDSPTAQFIGAEMRFGDKFVKNAPFSAETVIENTRRLYDGSTIVKQTKGAIYRDGAGRTRREQPLESIGGFSVVGENGSPQKLIFINDFSAKIHYFLDSNRKIARKNPLPDNRSPLVEAEPKDGKTESLGTKTIEGVNVEGTRITVEIPAGQIGNDKPLSVVTEKWFSPELQVVILSRHLDPIAGEHVFRLVNIKKGEPSAELFGVPNDFKIVASPKRGN